MLFFLLSLCAVAMGMIGQLGSCLLVKGLGELVNGRRYFEPFIEDVPLPLI